MSWEPDWDKYSIEFKKGTAYLKPTVSAALQLGHPFAVHKHIQNSPFGKPTIKWTKAGPNQYIGPAGSHQFFKDRLLAKKRKYEDWLKKPLPEPEPWEERHAKWLAWRKKHHKFTHDELGEFDDPKLLAVYNQYNKN